MRRICGLLLVAAVVTSGIAAASAAESESSTPTNWAIAARAGTGELAGVSCFGPNRCVAVGRVGDTPRTLVETWNLGRRTVVPSADIGFSSWLNAVSCNGAFACMAVGGYSDGTDEHPLAERWDGTQWTVVPTPVPAGNAELRGVSCIGAWNCIAVGTAFDGSDQPLAEHWSYGRWSITPLPELRTGWEAMLDGISCPTRNLCVAAGTTTPPDYRTQPLVEQWNGQAWSTMATPNEGNAWGRSLDAVSCSERSSCVAVGGAGSSTGSDPVLIERWDGVHWRIDPISDVVLTGFHEQLSGVACVSPMSCVAVGSAESGGVISGAWIMSWDGTRWSLTANRPGPYGPEYFSPLAAISCTFEHCAAVGMFRDAGAHPLGVSGTVPRRSVSVTWTPTENVRLHQLMAYLHRSPAGLQKLAVYALAYVTGGKVSPVTPVALPPPGDAATYTTVWDPSEFAPLDVVRERFALDSVGATRLAAYALSYAFALRGH